MGFRDYYRQFEEMAPEEISAELLARRDERRRKAVTKLDPLDLSGTTWHEPPHPDAVNAATFALRRAVNEPPDLAATRAAARRSPPATASRSSRSPPGTARASCCARCSGWWSGGGDALIGWPGWQPLPGMVEAAGGRAVPVAPAPAELLARAGERTRAVIVTSPADPTGALVPRRALRDLRARLPEHALLIVDEALGEFAPDGEDAAGLVADVPGLVVLRSFSKAHAMAGLRAGAALGPAELVARLAPSGGRQRAGAGRGDAGRCRPDGLALARRRRAAAHAAHAQLAAALAGSPVAAAPGGLPFAWLSSDAEDGPGAGRTARRARRSTSRPAGSGATSATSAPRSAGREAIDRLAAALRS